MLTTAISLNIGCSIFNHGGKSKAMPGLWQAKPIAVDGDCTDWPSPYPNYDAKAKIAYATSNDGTNLYITMQTGDPLTQIKILKQGMTVYIDTGGKKEQTFAINFPLQSTEDASDLFAHAESAHGEGPSKLSRQFDRRLNEAAESCNQYSLKGFGSCDGGYMAAQTSRCGISVKVSIDEYRQLVWEASIPFSALINKRALASTDSRRVFGVCYAVKSFKNPGSKGGNNNMSQPMNNANMPGGSNMGAGGTGMNSMPMGGGGGASKTSPLQHLYESTKTWKHFFIAYQ